ncbi:DUF6843 domain-containing protein [Pedobacter westerhofensis]|nr:hypothetical protein [Pedobacter westerhofensis]
MKIEMNAILRSKNIKITTSLYILLLVVLITSCTYWHNVNIKYIIPEGYEGMIVLAWDQKNGAPKIMEGDYEVYTFPANGFLKSEVGGRSMNAHEKFYSYNKATGKRMELKIIDPTISTDTISAKNEYYMVGSFSGGYEQTYNLVFFITNNKKSKFMDPAYREKYGAEHLDRLYEEK